MMKTFSGSPLHGNQHQQHQQQTPNHVRERGSRKSPGVLSAVPLRLSLRGYGFCMATLFFFCFGSLFYQLNGGPPKILLDIRQYLGKEERVSLRVMMVGGGRRGVGGVSSLRGEGKLLCMRERWRT